jgi:hypothetical protein
MLLYCCREGLDHRPGREAKVAIQMASILNQLEQNAKKRAQLAVERDELIFAAKTVGLPVTHIARSVGLSAMQVHRILREAWLVVDSESLAPVSWWRSKEAAALNTGTDGTRYYRQVELNEDGSWQ